MSKTWEPIDDWGSTVVWEAYGDWITTHHSGSLSYAMPDGFSLRFAVIQEGRFYNLFGNLNDQVIFQKLGEVFSSSLEAKRYLIEETRAKFTRWEYLLYNESTALYKQIYRSGE